MQYLNELLVELRITEFDCRFGCDVVNSEGELIFGCEPEFETVKEAIAHAVSQPEVGLCMGYKDDSAELLGKVFQKILDQSREDSKQKAFYGASMRPDKSYAGIHGKEDGHYVMLDATDVGLKVTGIGWGKVHLEKFFPPSASPDDVFQECFRFLLQGVNHEPI